MVINYNCDFVIVTAAAVAGIAEEQDMSVGVDGTMDVDSSEIIAAGVVDGGMISTDHISSLMGHSSHAPHLEVEISTEDQLRSVERLDRSSPDLWPQNCKNTNCGGFVDVWSIIKYNV